VKLFACCIEFLVRFLPEEMRGDVKTVVYSHHNRVSIAAVDGVMLSVA